MAKYKITDPQTGKAVTVSGDHEPTQAEAEEIFKTAGLRSTEHAPTDVLSYLGGQIANIPGSAARVAGDVGSAAVNVLNPNPDRNTLVNLLKLGIGTGQKAEDVPIAGAVAKAGHAAVPGYQLAEGLVGDQRPRAEAVGDYYKGRYGGMQNVNDTLYQDPVGSLVDISTLLSAGGTAVAKAGRVAKVSDGAKAGDAAAAAGAAVDPLAAMIKGVGTTGTGIGAAATKSGKALEDYGRELPLRSVDISKSNKVKFAKQFGEGVDEFIAKEGLADDPVRKAAQRTDELQHDFDEIALNSGKKVSTSTLDKSFQTRMKELSDSTAPSVKAKASEMDEILQNIKAKYGDDPDVASLTKERRDYDQLVKSSSQYGMTPEQANVYRNVRDALQDAIQESTADIKVNGRDLKEIGQKLRRYREFEKMTAGSEVPGSRSFLGSKLDAGGILASLATGNPLPFAAAKGYEIASRNPRVLSATSRGVTAVGRGLETAGPAIQGKLGALQRILEEINRKSRESGARSLPAATNGGQ